MGGYGAGGTGGSYGAGSGGFGGGFESSGYAGGGYGAGTSGRYGGQTSRQTFTGRGPRGYRRSDDRIEEEINEALTRHPDIDASDIEVKVESGEVTLSGTVDERHAKRLAEDIAESVSGVVDVNNHIKVKRGLMDRLFGRDDESDERESSRRDREVGRSAERDAQAARRGGTAGAGATPVSTTTSGTTGEARRGTKGGG